jgi:hypothetical protein
MRYKYNFWDTWKMGSAKYIQYEWKNNSNQTGEAFKFEMVPGTQHECYCKLLMLKMS